MMKIFRRKKTMILIISLAILFWVITGMLFVRIAAKKAQFNATLGETQLGLIENYIKGEKILFYIDQAAKYSIYAAIYDLSLNGGFFDYKCGDYKGYGLWQSEKEEMEYCSPDYKNSFSKFISTRLDSYINEGIMGINIPTNNYDFVFEEGEKTKIHGIATTPLSIPLLCGKDKTECGVYKVKPSFFQQVDYNLNDYEMIKEKLIKIAEECKKEQDLADAENLKQCVYSKMGSYKGLEWKAIPKEASAEEDRNFAFEAVSDKKMPFNDDKIVYKFAIFVPDEAPPPPIRELEVSKKEEDSIILKWEESKALDVKKYKIYYMHSDNEMDCRKIGEYYKNTPLDITKEEVIIYKENIIKDPTNPNLITQEIAVKDKKYCFAVTAIDKVENEINIEDAEAINYP